MEVTSFYPMIVTTDFEETKATYEALGFKVAHTLTDPLAGKNQPIIVMKNDKGLSVCVFPATEAYKDAPKTVTWMNVRDFEGTCALLKEKGFTEYSQVRDFEYMTTVAMKAPSGFVTVVVYHKRKDETE